MARIVVLWIALLSTLGFAVLTLDVLVTDGLDIIVVVALVIIALFTFGIVGALLNPPDE